jgi:hypothetical protein
VRRRRFRGFARSGRCVPCRRANAQPGPFSTAERGDQIGGASTQPLAKGHNSFTKSEAKSRIEKAGFINVTGLALDSDGLWQATASRDGQSLHVALDYKGDIAAE